jgi:predicted dienelactone hydrolase
MNHTGDNYADQSRSVDIMDRPRQVSRVIDHMLSTWEGVRRSTRSASACSAFPPADSPRSRSSVASRTSRRSVRRASSIPATSLAKLVAKSESPVVAPATTVVADARVKSAVVAAPALGFTFSPDGLKNVKVPVQLWRAENDVLVPHPRYAEAVRLALPETPDYHVVPNAGHYDFLAPCSDALASIAPAICTSAAGFDRAAFHAGFDSEVVKLF